MEGEPVIDSSGKYDVPLFFDPGLTSICELVHNEWCYQRLVLQEEFRYFYLQLQIQLRQGLVKKASSAFFICTTIKSNFSPVTKETSASMFF